MNEKRGGKGSGASKKASWVLKGDGGGETKNDGDEKNLRKRNRQL